MATKSKKVDEVKDVPMFSKEQIYSAKKYNENKDIINVLLTDGKEYSMNEVDALIDKFMKGKVK